MQELFPFAAGALVGLLVQLLRLSTRVKVVVFVVLCVVLGFLASWFSGELEVSWGFLSVDMALVWLGALVSTALLAVWRRRSTLTR